MEIKEKTKIPYKSPMWELIKFEKERSGILTTLSFDGSFDEVGFVGEDDATFGWGDERSIN